MDMNPPFAFAPRKTRENPHKIRMLGEAVFPRETSWPGVLGHPWSILRSRRICELGGAKVLGVEDQDKVAAAVVIPPGAKTLLEGDGLQ